MASIRAIAAIGLIAALSGCAHEISLTGDPAKLPALSTAPIDKGVALVVSDEDSAREVITPGGGGDKVSYRPYHDMELPIYVGLGHVFKNVTKFKKVPDAATMHAKHLDYVVEPSIKTTSSSSSLFTWPPTKFSVTLTCTVTDPAGQKVVVENVTGTGHAEFSQFRHNFSLAGQLAVADAVTKMQTALASESKLRN